MSDLEIKHDGIITRIKKNPKLCITCGKNVAINDFYKECEGCINKYEQRGV